LELNQDRLVERDRITGYATGFHYWHPGLHRLITVPDDTGFP
jgi:hypothetical protein